MQAGSIPNAIEARRVDAVISANGLMAISLTVAFAFSIICAAILWQERRSARDHAAETISSLVEAINSDIARTIEQYDLSLQGVVEGLKLPEIDKVSPQIRRAVLFDHSITYKYLGAIRVLDDAGKTVFDSRGSVAGTEDFSSEDLFLVHINVANVGLYISRPFNAGNGEAVVAFSRRLSTADGSFSGVVMGTLRLAYLHDLFNKVAPSPRSALTLFSTDGTVLMRFPFSAQIVGHSLPNAYVLQEFQKTRSGFYENVALIDGIRRLYTFKQVGNFPLLMTMGLPTDEVYAGWNRDALIIGLLILALCVATIFSAGMLRRELRRRMAAEEKLAVLATTDSLTGLSNRRHFDEVLVLAREWQRATRERASIGLLMIDADHFKTYNDTHGHQSGDKLLQAIGASIADRARRATDLGARYGGDEFVLLLPSIGGKTALQIAEWIRKTVRDLRLPSEASAATVSVGVAVITPRPGMDYRELIDAADKSVYQAKANGRDRCELIEPATEESGPRLVA
jgi:diguanylate cyclase (GGDEF)-like protein